MICFWTCLGPTMPFFGTVCHGVDLGCPQAIRGQDHSKVFDRIWWKQVFSIWGFIAVQTWCEREFWEELWRVDFVVDQFKFVHMKIHVVLSGPGNDGIKILLKISSAFYSFNGSSHLRVVSKTTDLECFTSRWPSYWYKQGKEEDLERILLAPHLVPQQKGAFSIDEDSLKPVFGKEIFNPFEKFAFYSN